MGKHYSQIKKKVLKIICQASPFSATKVEEIYSKTKSFDKTLLVIELMQEYNIDLDAALIKSAIIEFGKNVLYFNNFLRIEDENKKVC